MNLRHRYISRWLFEMPKSIQQVSPSPMTRPNFAIHRSPAVSSFTFHRAFGFSTSHTRTLQSQSLHSAAMPKGDRFRKSTMFRRFFVSSRPNSTAHSGQQPGSLSQRLRMLSKEYGWSALWIYLLLSAMDFPFCFAAVRLLGVERIGHYEHVILESAKAAINTVWPSSGHVEPGSGESKDSVSQEYETSVDASEQQAAGEEASLWTQLALAYAIHKSFIFVRVPLTAAITPKVVKVLRQWGWDIVRGKPKGL
ncbi:hypothetical protein BO70DRAFT_375319 [Aspergillus heteromorphus CBS 117.55]|uniref:DUF1279 domain-containing protein n=1 Tax=Aspergillus heteromorphus CBS 117.55 TaxID=1448321 RepID=A0A317UR28_9EURO|nr:uncharacterized protein BO70DRAFT_375319 [Aspergillus heteromorphus CBS 117.55]PWY63548.1 hypothetical protein BO70DRAFT_375319 [Aspergillus heteromorphus CBS 117.55]